MRLFFDVLLCIIGQGIASYTGHYHERPNKLAISCIKMIILCMQRYNNMYFHISYMHKRWNVPRKKLVYYSL